MTRLELLAKYRRYQEIEGATMEGELAIAKAQGAAWRAYLDACAADGAEPESADYPGGWRY